MTDTKTAKPVTKRPRKMAREPKAEPQGAGTAVAQSTAVNTTAAPTDPTKPTSKNVVVLGLLTRPNGATIDQLVAATGWLPHTTRAALTGLKKKGHVIISEKNEGVRRYRINGGAV